MSVGKFTSTEETVKALAPYAPVLACLNGALPRLADPELGDFDFRETRRGTRVVITVHDTANEASHRFGPFDPSEVSVAEAVTTCALRVHSTFN